MSASASKQLPSPADLKSFALEFERWTPQAILGWAIATYGARLVASCSFGGPTGMVVIDMLSKLDRSIPIAYLDTGLLFPETYALVRRVEEHYGIAPLAITSALSVQRQNDVHGEALWQRDPEHCCTIRKVRPQATFLAGYDAWITGMRRDQTTTRAATPIVQWDDRFGLAKINPLARWDERRVRRYITEHDVPYNILLDRGYASIGCRPCTRPLQTGESGRDGRWSGFTKIECGLHYEGIQS